MMNNPKAIRAIASTNGRNRLAIIIPCHRVIGSNGTMTGYAAGVDKKKWLLKFERNNSEIQEGTLF
jgi:O-6-methylguanine DNA methyltransferase